MATLVAMAPEEDIPLDVPSGRARCATCDWYFEPRELVIYKGRRYCIFCARVKEADEKYEMAAD